MRNLAGEPGYATLVDQQVIVDRRTHQTGRSPCNGQGRGFGLPGGIPACGLILQRFAERGAYNPAFQHP